MKNSYYSNHPVSQSRRLNRFRALLALALLSLIVTTLRAADVTWTNDSATSSWNLTDSNWSTGLWNNVNGDGAVFGATGAGTVTIDSSVNADSIGFLVGGYTLNGPGPISLVKGSSSLTTGYTFVGTGLTDGISSPIITSVNLLKLGGGTLELSGPVTFTGPGLTLVQTGVNPFDVFAAGLSSSSQGGTLRVMNTGVFAPTTRVGINNGLIDFGANDQTLAAVVINSQSDAVAWSPTTNSSGAGIIGTGNLRVTGDINVYGHAVGNLGANTIAMNLDLGGGMQVIRVGANNSFLQSSALVLTRSLFNGSLLKTTGINADNGFTAGADGMNLAANNTYTGATIINGGSNVASGTNASTSILISGSSGDPFGRNSLTLFGANGSFLSANAIQIFSGGILTLDSNASIPNTSGAPPVAAATNNNRLSDTADVQMRDASTSGGITLRSLSGAAVSETIGSVSMQGGHNMILFAPSGAAGTATLTVASSLAMSPRSTLHLSTTTLGAASKMFVNGTLPAADATGILPRIVGTNDFLTYNGTTGFTTYTGYAPDFTTAGTNVAVTAAASVPASVNVNAIKSTNSAATTIAAGQTLGVTSGMFLTTSGTRTYSGGTIALGATPGAFFGNNTISAGTILTGTSGLLNANGTLTLSGDLSGLSGTVTQNGQLGQLTLTTNTFAGPIEIRGGFFNLNTSLGAGGAITIGEPANDAHLLPARIQVLASGAGANAVIARDLIFDNGGLDAAGQRLDSQVLPLLAVLSNTTGSQTFSGNLTLNSPMAIQGGGASATSTGATIFSGNITGPGSFNFINGRANFTGTYTNAGGFYIGRGANSVIANFTGSGSAPLFLGSGNTARTTYTAGALPTGPITIYAGDPLQPPTLVPLVSSTINNSIALTGQIYDANNNLVVNSGLIAGEVGSGINAIWAGPISGPGALLKTGAGTLTLSNAANSYTGLTAINAGTLVGANDSAFGAGNVTLNAAGVQLTLQNGTSNNYIADNATLNIGSTSAAVNLPFTGTDDIKALVINGTPQATGTWGSPTSGAMHTDPIFTGNATLNVLNQLTVTSAVSRKKHGGTDFDLPLPLAPTTPVVESRQGNSTNDYTIIVNLSEAVTVNGNPQAAIIAGSGAIGTGGTSNGGKVTVSGNTISIPLTNIASGQTIQVRLNGVNGFSNFVIPMSVLIGDTNGDGAVNSIDILQAKSQSGAAVTASNFLKDVMVDGNINASDVALVKSKSGTALP